MTHVIENLVEQGSTSTGTTTIALSIDARAPFRAFADVMSDGDTTEAMVVNYDKPAEWQAAVYRYAVGGLTFVRLIDSSTGSQVNFSAGVKRVYMAPLAKRGEWVLRTGSFDVIPGDNSDVDTRAEVAAASVPASLSEGDRFGFNDFAGTWGTNAFTIDPNGHEFEDLGDGSDPTEPMTCDATARFELVFADGKLRVR